MNGLIVVFNCNLQQTNKIITLALQLATTATILVYANVTRCEPNNQIRNQTVNASHTSILRVVKITKLQAYS